MRGISSYIQAKQRISSEREQVRQQLEQLKDQRKELIAEHKKALSAIDKEIKALSGKRRTSTSGLQRADLSQKIIDILQANGETKTTVLKTELEEQGLDIKNLNQLAYLKRKGRIKNPKRGVYAIAGK